MDNPWKHLSQSNGEYLLEIDRAEIRKFNVGMRRPDCRIVQQSIPEPFIGSVGSAKIVLLLLNPGHDESDRQSHRIPEFKVALFRNLHDEQQEYAFYPLDPRFNGTASARWWIPRLRDLEIESGLTRQELATRVLALEWFPYHSRRSALPLRTICPSQEYTFEIAREMLRSKLVIAMRSIRYWAYVDESFSRVPRLQNPRSCYVSRRNIDSGIFNEMVQTLSH